MRIGAPETQHHSHGWDWSNVSLLLAVTSVREATNSVLIVHETTAEVTCRRGRRVRCSSQALPALLMVVLCGSPRVRPVHAAWRSSAACMLLSA